MSSILYCMCGISGSGKSTWAANYKSKFPHAQIVSTDAIREELFGDCRVQKDGDKIFQIAYSRIKNYLEEDESTIIFDAMSLKVKDRTTLISKFGSKAYMVCVVTGNDSVRAIENQYKRDRQVPEEVVLAQAKRFTKPTYEEGWNEIIYVC